MAINYTPLTDFLTKDTLPKEDPDKVILGADFDAEFNAISTAFAGAAPTNNPVFTGTATFDGVTVNTVTINGLVTAGSLDIGGNATVAGTLGVTGTATFGDTLDVAGDATFGGNVDVAGTLTANGEQFPTFEDVQDIVSGAELGPVSELDDLSNVDEAGKADGDFLVWNNAAGNWVPKTEEALDLSNLTTDVRTTAAIKAGSYEETVGSTTKAAGSTSFDYDVFAETGASFSDPVDSGSIQWSPDGTYFFTSTTVGNDLHRRYRCTQPGRLVGAFLEQTIDSPNLGFTKQNNSLAFSRDGLYIYGAAAEGNTPMQVTQVSQPFSLRMSDIVSTSSIQVLISGGYTRCIAVSDDGMSVFAFDDDDELHQWDMTTPHDLTTINTTPVHSATINRSDVGNSMPWTFCFAKEGAAVFFTDLTAKVIVEYTLTTAWDLSTISSKPTTTIECDLSYGGAAKGIGINPEGTMLQLGHSSNGVKEYIISRTSEEHTFDCSAGNNFEIEAADTLTIAFSNVPESGTAYACTVTIAQDATSGHAVSWPSSVKWAGGAGPSITSDPGGKDIFIFMTSDGGSTWYGFTAGQEFS